MPQLDGSSLGLRRVIRFGLVGAATAALYLLIGTLLWEVARVGEVAASMTAFAMAVIFNYAGHKGWSFQSRLPHRHAIARYVTTITIGALINAVVIHLTSEILGWHYLIAQLVAMSVLILWNFVILSLWVFRS